MKKVVEAVKEVLPGGGSSSGSEGYGSSSSGASTEGTTLVGNG